jgi:glucose/mannose-6-phosphate isomerase
VISSGGKLAKKAEHDGIPLITIKGGLPPRAALGYSFAPLLIVLSRLGLCGDQYEELELAIASLKRRVGTYAPDNPNNPATILSEKIAGNIPIVYAGFDRFDAVATRFKGQLNENAKNHAFANIFPEMCHNELVGWQNLHNIDKKFVIIILRDIQEHKRIRIRMEIVAEFLRKKNFEVVILEGQAGAELERVFYLIQYLDFTSYYLALNQGLDPFPIAPIDYLKEKLSKLN